MTKAKTKTNQDYFNIGRLASLILVFIFVTAYICGICTRFKEGKPVAAIIRIFFGWNIIWFCDIISMIFTGRIIRVFDV